MRVLKNDFSRYIFSSHTSPLSFLPPSLPYQQIHWLSIINSFVLVLLLTAFLAVILMRVLKNDFSRYMELDDDDLVEEESGWKLIHGDVFRFPSHINLFSAVMGSGVQVRFAFLLCVCLYVCVYFSSYYKAMDEDDIVEEESGWKLIHGDVFRFPSHMNLFSAVMGSGVQVRFAFSLVCVFVCVCVYFPSCYKAMDEDDLVEEESGWKLIHGDVFRFPSHMNLFSAVMGSGVRVRFAFPLVCVFVCVCVYFSSSYKAMDEDDIVEEESGWKLIHGDVSRFPSHINSFSAVMGSGVQVRFAFPLVCWGLGTDGRERKKGYVCVCLFLSRRGENAGQLTLTHPFLPPHQQLCVTTFLLLICALSGVFRATKRGSILTSLILIYVLTSFINGYISARLYKQSGGKNWTWNIVTAALVFPGPLAVVWSFLNSVAWSQASTAALPAATIFIILGLFLFVSFPLSVVGGIAGRNTAGEFEAPCRTKKVAREVSFERGRREGGMEGGREGGV